MVVHTPEGGLLIDAGFSARELRRRLHEAGVPEESLRAILVTHEHDDHVKGLRVLSKLLNLPVYANRETASVMRDHGKAPEQHLHLFTPGAAFAIGGFTVEPFSIPHDAADPMAFAIHWGAFKAGIVTDLGHANPLAQHHLGGCDVLVVESNHDPEMLWNSSRPLALKQRIRGKCGHLSNAACAELVGRILAPRTRHLVLAHASQECNRYELVEQTAVECLRRLGRVDLRPCVARQACWLPAVWV